MCTATFIEQFESLKAENARLSERVKELEEENKGLHEECKRYKRIQSLWLFASKEVETFCNNLERCRFESWERATSAEARLSQAEGLLRSKAERLKIPRGNNWIPDPDVAAFLHPEQEKPCKN